MDCCLPGSSVYGLVQARTLEWVAVPSSRGPWDGARVSGTWEAQELCQMPAMKSSGELLEGSCWEGTAVVRKLLLFSSKVRDAGAEKDAPFVSFPP